MSLTQPFQAQNSKLLEDGWQVNENELLINQPGVWCNISLGINKIAGKVPYKLLASSGEAEGAEAAVWRGGHTHWSLLGVSSSSSSTSSSSPPHALVRVTHRKRGSEGMKSKSAGNEESKHHVEGVAGWRECQKECVRGQTFCVCICVCARLSVCVSSCWTVCDDTFPLCLH